MFGALAKNVFGKAGTAHNEEEEIEELLGRVSEGRDIKLRRDALAQLRDVAADNPKAQLALGSMGMPILVSVLHDERNDLELLRGAVDCLHVAMAAPSGWRRSADDKSTPAWAVNAEHYGRGEGNIGLLLGLLEDEAGGGCADFYVQYSALMALTALQATIPFKLREAVLSSGTGMSRLVAMLGQGQEEVLRNEALVLVAALAAGSAELQKLVAFEGGFDGAWRALEGEGGAHSGSGVVEDALDLAAVLVQGNAHNQLLFRETGFLAKLAAFIKEPAADAAAGAMTRQQAANYCAALQLAVLLLAPPAKPAAANGGSGGAAGGGEAADGSANRLAAQAVLLKEGLLDMLLSVGISRATTAAVRGMVLRVVAGMVADNRAAQDKLAALTVTAPYGQIPMLQAVLRVSLYGADGEGRATARGVLHAYCRGNLDGQLALASTIAPLCDKQQDALSFGAELVRALCSADLSISSRGAGAAALLLEGNPDAKERALTIPLALRDDDAPSNRLMPRAMSWLQAALATQGDRPGLAVAAPELLRLLFTWCYECPAAVAALATSSTHVPLLVDVVKKRVGSPHPLTQGLAALLLGACLLYAPPPAPGGMGAGMPALADEVLSRVGLPDFLGALDAMKGHAMWKAAAAPPVARAGSHRLEQEGRQEGEDSDSLAANPLDADFIQLVTAFEPRMRDRLSHELARGAGSGSSGTGGRGGATVPLAAGTSGGEGGSLAEALAAVQRLERELSDAQRRNATLAQDVLRLSSGGAADSSAAPGDGGSGAAALAAAELRASRAESAAADAQRECRELTDRVASLSAELGGARRAAEEAAADAARLQGELEDLGAAYNQLEAHSNQVEAQLQELQAAGTDGSRGGTTGADEAEVAARIEAAVAAAVAAAEAENEDGMGDLLVCLGQEELKVERLRTRLEELGEDVDAMLEGLAVAQEEEESLA